MVIINNRIHLSVKEVATKLNVAPTTVYGWLNFYQLPRTMVGANILIADDDLSSFMAKKQDRRKKGWNKKKATEKV